MNAQAKTMPGKVRVVAVNLDEDLRGRVAARLACNERYQLAGHLNLHDRLPSGAVFQHADVMFLRLPEPPIDEVEFVRHLHRIYPKLSILTVSEMRSRETIAALLGVGAAGCLCRSSLEAEMMAALETVSERNKYVSLCLLKGKGRRRAMNRLRVVRRPRANLNTQRLHL
ncbi:MAG: hypothetical protein V2A34_09890 [Lentisphaerota bacterium]